jgi:CRP-like cAMP-binding protein
MALVSNARRNATVRCTAPMDVLALPKRDFGLLAAHLPGVHESVARVIEERTRSA